MAFSSFQGEIGRRLPDGLAWRLRHLRSIGRWPNLRSPRRFNEKVIWRELNDRRPILARLDNKFTAREIASERAPDIHLPDVIWTGTSLLELTDKCLPKRWVLKPTNSTHRVLFGEGSLELEDLRDLEIRTRGWLECPQLADSITGPRRPWVETQAEGSFIVERFIGAGTNPPTEMKLFVFSGKVELILVRQGPEPGRERAYFDRDWKRLDVTDSRGTSVKVSLPSRRDALIEAAEVLSGAIDFIRVDLYEAEGEIWFGEFTPNPGWGLFRFHPDGFDRELGRRWKLPSLPAASEP